MLGLLSKLFTDELSSLVFALPAALGSFRDAIRDALLAAYHAFIGMFTGKDRSAKLKQQASLRRLASVSSLPSLETPDQALLLSTGAESPSHPQDIEAALSASGVDVAHVRELLGRVAERVRRDQLQAHAVHIASELQKHLESVAAQVVDDAEDSVSVEVCATTIAIQDADSALVPSESSPDDDSVTLPTEPSLDDNSISILTELQDDIMVAVPVGSSANDDSIQMPCEPESDDSVSVPVESSAIKNDDPLPMQTEQQEVTSVSVPTEPSLDDNSFSEATKPQEDMSVSLPAASSDNEDSLSVPTESSEQNDGHDHDHDESPRPSLVLPYWNEEIPSVPVVTHELVPSWNWTAKMYKPVRRPSEASTDDTRMSYAESITSTTIEEDEPSLESPIHSRTSSTSSRNSIHCDVHDANNIENDNQATHELVPSADDHRKVSFLQAAERSSSKRMRFAAALVKTVLPLKKQLSLLRRRPREGSASSLPSEPWR